MARGGFRLELDVMGDKVLSRGFSRYAEDVQDMHEAFEEIAADFWESNEKQFVTEGKYGGGRWRALAPSTLRAKPGGLPTLVREGTLKDSLTKGNPWTIEKIEPLQVTLGTKVPYALYHQRGTGNMPKRPVIAVPETQRTRWHKIIQRYLVQQAPREVK